MNFPFFVATTLAWLAVVNPVGATHSFRVSIMLDGKEILTGRSSFIANPPRPHLVWRCLKSTPVSPKDGHQVQPVLERPLEAVLTGQIRVDVGYGLAVDTPELRLVRR